MKFFFSIFFFIISIVSYFIIYNPENLFYFNQLQSLNDQLITVQENNKQLLQLQQENSYGLSSIVKLENLVYLTIICLTFYVGYSFYTSSNNTKELFSTLNEATALNSMAVNEHITITNKDNITVLNDSIQALANQQTKNHTQITRLIFDQVIAKLDQTVSTLDRQHVVDGALLGNESTPIRLGPLALANATWTNFNN